MDLRSETRFSTDQPVNVTILGERQMTILGRIANVSEKGMRLLTSAGAPPGVAIRVDVEGTVLLGEVCYCIREGSGYAIGLQLERVLTLTEDLSRLIRHLLEESDAGQDNRRQSHDTAVSARRPTSKQHRK